MANNVQKLQEYISTIKEEGAASDDHSDPILDIQKALDEGDFEDGDGFTRVGRLFIINYNWDYSDDAFWLSKLREHRIYPHPVEE